MKVLGSIVASLSLVAALSFVPGTLLATRAQANPRPLPAGEWDQGTRLTLAQVMVGEADWNEPDHVAIAWVLARRWQRARLKSTVSFQDYMQRYSSPMKVDSERARWVRALPWGELPGPHKKRWSRVLELVNAWGAGKLSDPCPNAEHWGGTMDRPGRSWEPISCGLTRNIFYAPRNKQLASR
jgi:hypothetical protein